MWVLLRPGCVQQAGEHSGVQPPQSGSCLGTLHLLLPLPSVWSALPPPQCPLGSQDPGPHSAGVSSDASLDGGVTGCGVALVGTEASTCGGECCMGSWGPEPMDLWALVITFFRKHVYTCGEVRVIPSDFWVPILHIMSVDSEG